MRQVILDTETTGLSTEEGHRIIEIGCLELVNRKLTGKRYHQYINPQRDIDRNAAVVHGIENQFLQDKPVFSEIADEFFEFVDGAELIIHNASFDIGFINYEFSLLPGKSKLISDYCQVIDTLTLARQLHPGQRNSLDALCKRYGVDNSQRDLHGALLDANLLAQVYLAMTGGQGTLFDDITENTSFATQKTKIFVPKKQRKLRVIQANEQECAEHEERLQALLSKGVCLWLQEK